VAKEELARRKAEAVEGRLRPKREKPSPVFATDKLLQRLSSELVNDGSFAYRFLVWSETNKRSFMRDRTLVKALGRTFGGLRLKDISPFLIEKHRKLRKEEGRAVRTINYELACLRTMFNKAIAWGDASSNPMRQVKLAKEDNSRTRYLEPHEERALMDALPPWLKPLVIAALHTGFRARELLTLTWEAVDFHAGVVTVRAAYAKSGETRSVPMDATLTGLLKALKETAPDGGMGIVFRNRAGKPYSRSGYRKGMQTALRKAGIKDFRFHDLRHCFGSYMAMEGVHPVALQRLMGHKDAKMTARYTHLSPDYLRDAIKVLDARQGRILASESHQFSHQRASEATGGF